MGVIMYVSLSGEFPFDDEQDIFEQLNDFKLEHFKISEKRSRGKAIGMLIKYGKNIFKFLKKKAKPKKGGPKATKNDPKATKGGADANSTSVLQKAKGAGSKIMGNVW